MSDVMHVAAQALHLACALSEERLAREESAFLHDDPPMAWTSLLNVASSHSVLP